MKPPATSSQYGNEACPGIGGACQIREVPWRTRTAASRYGKVDPPAITVRPESALYCRSCHRAQPSWRARSMADSPFDVIPLPIEITPRLCRPLGVVHQLPILPICDVVGLGATTVSQRSCLIEVSHIEVNDRRSIHRFGKRFLELRSSYVLSCPRNVVSSTRVSRKGINDLRPFATELAHTESWLKPSSSKCVRPPRR